MLKEPDVHYEAIVACLLENYDLHVKQVAFLPLGADQHTAVYRVVAEDEAAYFLKLRQGEFNDLSVALPKFLSDQGIRHIIAPLTTTNGSLQATLDPFKVILYPFVEGQNGYEAELSDRHWIEFGTALRQIQATELPAALLKRIGRESFSARWREAVKTYLTHARDGDISEPVSEKLAAFLLVKGEEILYLSERAEQLAVALQARLSKEKSAEKSRPDFVLCHADAHAGNILIGADGAFYLVDWDEAILAPKERDLMFVGGGLMGDWRSPQEEEAAFYPAYGQTAVDQVGLAYYRYERIVQDIAVICEYIFSESGSIEDREQFFRYLASNFLPNSTIAIAQQTDKAS